MSFERVNGGDAAGASGGEEGRRRRVPLRSSLIWLAAVAAFGLLQFSYHYLGVLAEHGSQPALEPLINEMTGALAGGLVFFPTLWLVRARPLAAASWRRRLPLYLVALLLLAPAATTTMWGLRALLYPLAGLGRYDYGVMPLRYFMELPLQAIGFTVMVGAIHAVLAFRAAREREVQAAQLESSLARAQLRSLRLQLQPHFLFNALNTVSSTMYEDPAAADEILDRLATLLRASLHTSQTDEVPLAAELDLLEQYLAIMRSRLGEELRVTTLLEPGLAEALVPSMILQPLVENAIRHGNATLLGRGAVEVRARRVGEQVVLEVEDDGPGAAAGRDPLRCGVGLSATAERLRLLYGAAHTFTAGDGPGGGFLVRATLPLRLAPMAGA